MSDSSIGTPERWVGNPDPNGCRRSSKQIEGLRTPQVYEVGLQTSESSSDSVRFGSSIVGYESPGGTAIEPRIVSSICMERVSFH